MDFITSNILVLVGSSATAIAVWGLKKIPNELIYDKVKTSCYWLGSALTLGLGRWSITKDLWNKTVEPYFVDLVDNTVGAAIQGFIEGLRSDND